MSEEERLIAEAELERERTQNIAWRALVDASEPVLSSAHDVLLGLDAGLAGRCVSVLGRIDAARAALSTPSLGDRDTPRNREHADRVDRAAFPDLPESQRYVPFSTQEAEA